jgi:hypothetical protein
LMSCSAFEKWYPGSSSFPFRLRDSLRRMLPIMSCCWRNFGRITVPVGVKLTHRRWCLTQFP